MANVLNFSLIKFKKGDTEYGIGWFPLGGYVKIAGMVDESMDKEAMKAPAQPWEFRSKKPWQRLIVMLGGIIVNLIVGVLIFIGLTGIVWAVLFWRANPESKWGQVFGNLLSEWGQMAGLVFLTKRLVEIGSKE